MDVNDDLLKELILIKEKMAVIEVENRYVQSLDSEGLESIDFHISRRGKTASWR